MANQRLNKPAALFALATKLGDLNLNDTTLLDSGIAAKRKRNPAHSLIW
jgi:hypothetical protein